MICRSFEPVFSPQAKIMIVGSMPGIKSLADAQYYAHPRNAFWPILFEVFGAEPTADYEAKKQLIHENGLALWDVAGICERKGSLDSNMKDIQYNDFASLYESCPHIHTVLCNGGAAYSLFLKSGYAGDRRVVRMPSTSPAYTMAYENKLKIWKETIREVLQLD
ncbi:MAG: DNA-deoxyinosine glycosylase [Clostridiales bacterium]|nr:DNA-deoxyinosine glycosylase [Clostridiales bacterium]